jgi:hypothetical protein
LYAIVQLTADAMEAPASAGPVNADEAANRQFCVTTSLSVNLRKGYSGFKRCGGLAV